MAALQNLVASGKYRALLARNWWRCRVGRGIQWGCSGAYWLISAALLDKRPEILFDLLHNRADELAIQPCALGAQEILRLFARHDLD